MLDLVDHLAATRRAGPRSSARRATSLAGTATAGRAGRTARTIELDRLSADEAAASSRPPWCGSAMPPATLRTIVETAGGNPLFLEQMLAMLQDAPGGDVAVPPTIQRPPLCPARPARRRRSARSSAPHRSSGQVFPEAAVVELVPDARRPRVPEDLGGLERRRLVQSHAAS